MAHLRSILAMARKDGLDIWLDKTKLAALVFPLTLAFLWFGLSHLPAAPSTPPSAKLLVYNPSQSPLQQAISGVFAGPRIAEARSPQQVAAAFPASGGQSASYDVGLVIPVDFDASLKSGSRPDVHLYLNNATVNSQQAALLQAAIRSYARAVVAPTSPVNLVTSTIHSTPAPTSASPTVGSFFASIVLPISFVVSLGLLPGLLIEEKEKKTVRMLLVAPASFNDVMVGKVFIVFVYQIPLSVIVLALFGAFSMNAPLVLLYMLCGVILALSAGLLLGTLLDTAGAVSGPVAATLFAILIPAIFVALAPYIGTNPISEIIKALPTYYLADGVYNALNNQGSLSSNILDSSITLGCALVMFAGTVWALQRRPQVATTV